MFMQQTKIVKFHHKKKLKSPFLIYFAVRVLITTLTCCRATTKMMMTFWDKIQFMWTK